MAIPPTRYINAGPGLPQANPGAAMAQGQAMARLGNTISHVGERGLQIAEKIRRIDETGKMSAFFANIDEEAAKFSNSLLTRTDPDAWPTEWRERVQEFKQAARAQELSPEARAKLDLQIQDWSTQRTIRFETLAAQRQVTEGKARISNSIQYYASRGDTEGMQRELARLPDAGFMPSEIEQVEREADRIANLAGVETDIELDPILAMRRLESDSFLQENPGVTLSDVARLKRTAAGAVQERRSAELETFETALMEGTLQPEDIETGSAFLTKKDKLALTQALAKKDPPSNEDHAAAWKHLDDLRTAKGDPSVTSEEYRQRWNETRASVLSKIPPQWQGDIKKELNYLDPTTHRSGDGELPGFHTKEDLAALGRTTAFRARDAGLLGDVSDDAPPAVREKAFRRAEDIRLEVKRYVATNPQASPQDVREFSDRLISGGRTTSAASTLRTAIPGAGTSLRLDGSTAPGVLPPRDDLDSFLSE